MLLPQGELNFKVMRDGHLTSSRPGMVAKIDGVDTPIDGRVPVRVGQRVTWKEHEARGLGELFFHFA